MPWLAKRKYRGSSPSLRRTKPCKWPIVSNVNLSPNVHNKSLSFGGEAIKSNLLQCRVRTCLKDQPANQDKSNSKAVLRTIDLNVHRDHAKDDEEAQYLDSNIQGEKVISRELVARRNVTKVIDLYEELLGKNLTAIQSEETGGHVNSHIYVAVAKQLQKQHEWIKVDKRFGSIPGIKVGDKFLYRAELFLIGLHCQFWSGIDYVVENENMLATSIVHSSRYENDISASFDILVYSGHGGNPHVGADARGKDQKLEKGNMALWNNIRTRTPVRVIYGSKPRGSQKNTSGIQIYVYIGMYSVVKCWQERGQSGKLVFKFLLKRVLEKPEPTLMKEDRPERHEIRKENNDLSRGKEKVPIRFVNDVDDEQLPSFNYITNTIYPNSSDHSSPPGCNLKNRCCGNNGEGGAAYKDGFIVKFKPLIYECGPSCKSSSCPNKVSQRGVRFQLEVFKSKSKCWGVRSRDHIPRGSFICEYTGKISRESIVERNAGNEKYFFDIGRFSDGNDITYSSSGRRAMPKMVEGFTIDATEFGNVGRFMNRSNDSNVRAQYVVYDHDDKRMPHVMLFATKNIPPMKELTYSIL